MCGLHHLQARAAALSPLREAERAARDLEFEGRLAERSVRSEPLGCDRYFRRYWWLPGRLNLGRWQMLLQPPHSH